MDRRVLVFVIGLFSACSGSAVVGLPSPPIVYPYGGTFKLVVGFAVPIELSGRILVYGQNFQFQYPLPQNATLFTEFFSRSSTARRSKRNVPVNDRQVVYEYLEHEYRRQGFGEVDCLKRSICEASMDPLQDEGLVGEMLHLLLTPDYGDNSGLQDDYLRAAKAGRKFDDCSVLYPSCTHGNGILHRISQLIRPSG